jgi:2-polyprenyl-6-methoxyphenol hydroxylase-like FAD-dependent oxidoreductase
MRVIVVGAGIGGLCAAIALRRAGADVAVYEQADALREVGAGVQLSPNATRILARWGLGDALARIGVRPHAIEHRRWDDGRLLMSQPLGDACERAFGAPYYHLYRPDLLAMLVAALPAEVVRLAHRCVEIVQHTDGATVRFDNGIEARGDLVIGADGIHSTVRALLLGPESPHFSGSVAYRGLVPAERLHHVEISRTSTAWLGPGRHFVRYFVGAGRFVNWVGIVPAGDWRVESWSATGEVPAALAEFADWYPEVRTIIAASDATHRWALYDRDPLQTWTVGHVALLGDAAHAMLPFLAQGACQAVEDATVLSSCVCGEASILAALERYQAVRQPRVWEVQRISRRNASTYHLPDGPDQQARDAAYAASATRTPYAERGWLFAFDAETPAAITVPQARA